MPSSLEYWRDREEVQRQKNITEETAYNREIEKIHNRMLKQIQDRINAFYTIYANSEGLTLAEAKKKVAAFDVEAFSEKAARYVKNKDFSKRANEELRLYNATMKLNRLELLKSEIGLDMVDGFDELEKMFGEKLTERTLSEFARQAGILGNSVVNPEKLAHSIVNASFHNATFSDRVWAHHDILKSDLDKLLSQALIQGLNPRALISNVLPNVGDTVKNRRYAAMRLLTTELCRVQIDAQMRSFERNGFDKYIFLAEPTACPHCRALDDKVFDVRDAMPGENAPPLHPNCRCSTAAAVDEEEHERWFYKETGQHSAGWQLEHGTASKDLVDSQDWYQERFKRNKSRVMAKDLIKEAEKHEPVITKAVKKAAAHGTGKLTDLATKIKSVNSLTDKLVRKLKNNPDIQEVISGVHDALRYTIVSKDSDIVKNYDKAIEYFKNHGYNVIEVSNTFIDDKSAYKGINTVIANKGGYKFEIQFHTPSSLEIKHKNHSLYKEEQNSSTTENRKKEIRFEMKQNASKVKVPQNIDAIKEK